MKFNLGTWFPLSGHALCGRCHYRSDSSVYVDTVKFGATLCDRCHQWTLIFRDVASLHLAVRLVQLAGGQAEVEHTGGGCVAAVYPIDGGVLVVSDINDALTFFPGDTWRAGPPEDAVDLDADATDPDEVASLVLSAQAEVAPTSWRVTLKRVAVERAYCVVEAKSRAAAEAKALDDVEARSRSMDEGSQTGW